jgi:ribulose-5-phosphate 4-epimerase/fuculose-1-phosphate aldolase
MEYSIVGRHEDESVSWFATGLTKVLEENGHEFLADPDQASLIINFVDPSQPKPFRRKAQAIFVVSVTEVDPPFGGPMEKGYPLLVRSLCNLLIGLVKEGEPLPTAHFVTPEQGHYVVSGSAAPEEYFRAVYARIRPIATSRLVLNNIYHPDLPEELWKGDAITDSIARAGKKLDELNLLPTPFPMEKYLNERDQRHLKLLYGIGGLSYGNLSARLDGTRFWMSASGVDKSNLQEVGRDILLVKDYDAGENAMVLSVPPHVEPRRVSVDAIEHWMIYREHPEVGAILHVHAWMDGAPSTEFNYPCGTYELGVAVADIVRASPVPAEAVVGLKNHGLTIVGRTMDDIFQRVEGELYQPVPMS